MRIFVAGASGAIGTQLVPALVASGHDVVGMIRRPEKQELIRQCGARPILADGLDPEAVARAVAKTEPEVIVNQLTALTGVLMKRDVEAGFAATNRLRTEGTDNLLAAAKEVGTRRFVAQSFAGWPYERSGAPAKDETAPLDPSPPKPLRTTHAAIRHLEGAVTGPDWIEGLVLRYGLFYGPGTSISLDPPGEHVEQVRRRSFPVVGNGAGVWSLVHVGDAAAATLAAVNGGEPGIYNVVDDEPAPVSEWLPVLAVAVGAEPPRHVPRWLARLVAGEAAVVMMTEIRGATNAKAKRELGWQPLHPSWRQGFRDALG